MDEVLAGLRAAAESTRLRLLALLGQGELSVTDLVRILGQSQPRISRHLKLMCEGGLLDRYREGAWVMYRLAGAGAGADLARRLLGLLPGDDPLLAGDARRLADIKRRRADEAARYFRENAQRWNVIRSMHVDDREVEAALLALLRRRHIGDLLDVGTGTGRMLEVLGPLAQHAVGIDLSREMLALARAALERAGLRHCMVRQGDMYHLPLADSSFDAVVLHQVLHYAEGPATVVAEAARVLRPGGRLVVVDFAPHGREELRREHNHLRLGFADAEVAGWYRAATLDPGAPVRLPGPTLTVTLWPAERAGAEAARPAPAASPTAAGVPA